MHTRTGRLVLLAVLALAFVPSLARGQGDTIPPPEVNLPSPFGGDPFRTGHCFYVDAEFLFLRTSNPIKRQLVARRGFVDVDGSITGAPGTFVGSATEALHTDDLQGPQSWQPGLSLGLGWKFDDGSRIEVNWWHVTDAKYSATASILPQNFAVGPLNADTFLTSGVYNFPPNYSGPATVLNVGNPGATFGIWNASTVQTIDYVQRFDQVSVNLYTPIEKGECYRFYGMMGARAVVLWDRFRWLTVKANIQGVETPIDSAWYTNIVSNRLYGATAGCAYDYYLGDSPVGAFFISAELQGSLMIDIVKERARYELGDHSTAASRSRGVYTFAPMAQGNIGINWIPYEAIQCRIGWDLMAIFNTMSSPHPIDLNFGALAPEYRSTIRLLQGFQVGFAVAF